MSESERIEYLEHLKFELESRIPKYGRQRALHVALTRDDDNGGTSAALRFFGGQFPTPATLRRFCEYVGLDTAKEFVRAGYPNEIIALLPQIAKKQNPAIAVAYGVRLFRLDCERLPENGSVATATKLGNPFEERDGTRLPPLLVKAQDVFRDRAIKNITNRRTIAHAYVRAWLRETYPEETKHEEVTGAFVEHDVANVRVPDHLHSYK